MEGWCGFFFSPPSEAPEETSLLKQWQPVDQISHRAIQRRNKSALSFNRLGVGGLKNDQSAVMHPADVTLLTFYPHLYLAFLWFSCSFNSPNIPIMHCSIPCRPLCRFQRQNNGRVAADCLSFTTLLNTGTISSSTSRHMSTPTDHQFVSFFPFISNLLANKRNYFDTTF